MGTKLARCPGCRGVFNLETGVLVPDLQWPTYPPQVCPRCERDPAATKAVRDTLPAPEVHPVRADVLEAWANGLPFQDTTENERAVYEFLAYLARKESAR